MKESRKESRLKRAKRARCKQRSLGATRLVVNKTSQHIYAQIIVPGNALQKSFDKVVATVSTLNKEVRETTKVTSNVEAAKTVGKLIAEKARGLGLTKLAFDRSGNLYHGRIKALADSVREHGLEI